MNPLRRLLHRLAHRLHWQLGRVVSATDSRGRVWVGFECATCGQVTGASIALGEPRMSESQTAPARAPVFRCAACGAIWRTQAQRDRCCTATAWAERITRDESPQPRGVGMKKPSNWPEWATLKKLSKADAFGSGAEWGVFDGKTKVGTLYRSSRGWAFAMEEIAGGGGAGQGYDGMDTMQDAMWDMVRSLQAWRSMQKGAAQCA